MWGDAELEEFEAKYGSELVDKIMDTIHGLGRDDQYKWHRGLVYLRSFETLDREGGNVRYKGEVKVGPRYWEFDIQSGNWAGTEIHYFERMIGGRPPPAQTAWMCHPAAAVVTMMFLKKQDKFLRDAYANFVNEKKEAAIWKTKFI